MSTDDIKAALDAAGAAPAAPPADDPISEKVAVMHPENTTPEPAGLKVHRHPAGPMEGYYEALAIHHTDGLTTVVW